MMPARGGTTKAFWRGTHRTQSPKETLRRVETLAGRIGVTRLANITGLDYLGVPVFATVRPAARSLSVSQGKGVDEDSAAASAFMEALEVAHAERPALRKRVARYIPLRKKAQAVDPNALPRLRGSADARKTELAWVEGADLATGEPVFVPFDVVHLDTCPGARRTASPFFWSSNGLASGNHWLEAVCAGLCEVIERDALSLWRRWTARERAARRIAPRTIRAPTCRALLDRIEERGIKVAMWNITSDIGVACFVCRIDDDGASHAGLGAFWGAGAHLARDVALTRAVTEAVQSRLTYIAGARDDLSRAVYDRLPAQSPFPRLVDHLEERRATLAFDDAPDNAGATFENDLSRLLAGLHAAGLTQVIALDLTDQSIGVPVVRIIVPGLEGHDEDGRVIPGPRARARMGAAS